MPRRISGIYQYGEGGEALYRTGMDNMAVEKSVGDMNAMN